jgi:hypothetical protein
MRIVAITFHVNLHPVRHNAWQSKLKGPLGRYLRMQSSGDTRRISMQFPRHQGFRDVLRHLLSFMKIYTNNNESIHEACPCWVMACRQASESRGIKSNYAILLVHPKAVKIIRHV